MRWLRKRLFWAAVGFYGVAGTVAAQTGGAFGGVVLTRPNPVAASAVARPVTTAPVSLSRPVPLPESIAPRGLPIATAAPAVQPPVASGVQQTNYTSAGYTARGQMDDGGDSHPLTLPDAPQHGGVRTAAQITAEAVPGESTREKKDGNSSADSKKFVPPPPRTLQLQNGDPKGASQTAAIPDGTIIIFEDAVENFFGGPVGPSRFYARAEYLNWWVSGYHVPVLAATGPATVPEDIRGALGVPGSGAVPLLGGNTTNFGPSSGFRVMGGWNFDPCGCCGLDGGFFSLGRRSNNSVVDSGAFPVLSRPFFNVNTGMPDRELTATPGLLPGDFFKLNGSITVHNFTDLWGAEANFRRLLCADCDYTVSALAGFRYLSLHEGLSITENIVSAMAVPGFPIFNPGNQIVVTDTFNTRNQFYGGQLGLDGDYRMGRWFVGGRAQLGLGVTHQTIDIAGSQVVTTPAGVRSTFAGGLLALPSNSGSFSQNRFSVVPQAGLRVGYNLTPNVRVFVGYDVLYWSSVVRPGDQVDTSLNVTQIPNFGNNPAFTPASNIVRPIVPFHTTGLFVHGVNAGLEVRY